MSVFALIMVERFYRVAFELFDVDSRAILPFFLAVWMDPRYLCFERLSVLRLLMRALSGDSLVVERSF